MVCQLWRFLSTVNVSTVYVKEKTPLQRKRLLQLAETKPGVEHNKQGRIRYFLKYEYIIQVCAAHQLSISRGFRELFEHARYDIRLSMRHSEAHTHGTPILLYSSWQF